MPRQPAALTYNDLNGEEIREIIEDWVHQLLISQPYLQRHLTLPRVRIDLVLVLHQWAESPGSEAVRVDGSVTINNDTGSEGEIEPLPPVDLHAVVDASPSPGGHLPDQVREQHGLPVLRPQRGDRAIGAHIITADAPDRPPAAPRRQGDVADGYVFAADPPAPQARPDGEVAISAYGKADAVRLDLTGEGRMHQGGLTINAPSHVGDGALKGKEYGAVTGTLDAGPAGLATGRPPRSKNDFSIGRKAGGG